MDPRVLPTLSLSSTPLSQVPILHPAISSPNPNPNLILPTADLPTTISLLKDLAALAESTIQSASTFLSLPPTPDSAGFVRCPFDPRHRMPPESLFRHSLLCPSAPGAPLLDLSFLDTLRYPTSFKSESQIQHENRFVLPVADSDADLCFSLESELGHFGSNFFYRDCPGVVTTPEPDASARTFTLPATLSAECSNFVSESGCLVLGEGGIQILPSEFWALRCEVEAWRDYPDSLSYTALRVASLLLTAEEGFLKKWVISNSSRYGILIDVPMRDHICLLLKLCLKAIAREAQNSLKLLLSKDDGFLYPRSLDFRCRRLVGSLTWLASQLSVLYGETNGKFFVVGMLKESLLHTGSSLLLIKLRQDKVGEDGCGSSMGAGVEASGQVFVSQVASAVAALHERFLLEERVKMLRFAQPLSKYQLLSEYSYASTRGSEERGKRPNYRAVIEYDGLHWQRVQNQDQGIAKTREDLLAEERDYKRRRMSYRGKKVKRNPTQVIRDIIEEHMEEIKQTGGSGCNLKVAENTVGLPLECNSQSEITANIHELQNNSYDRYERRGDSSVYMKPPHAEYALASRKQGDFFRYDRSSKSYEPHKSHKKMRYESSDSWEDHKRSKYESEKNYESRSPPSRRSYAQSHGLYAHQNDRGDAEAHKTKYDRSGSRLKDHIIGSTLTSTSTKEEYEFLSDTGNKQTCRADSRRSDSVMQNAFEDRYNPSGSYDGYYPNYDDASEGSDYLRSGKFLTNDAKYHAERQRHDHTSKRHHHDRHKN